MQQAGVGGVFIAAQNGMRWGFLVAKTSGGGAMSQRQWQVGDRLECMFCGEVIARAEVTGRETPHRRAAIFAFKLDDGGIGGVWQATQNEWQKRGWRLVQEGES
jgi:hypothetical protein